MKQTRSHVLIAAALILALGCAVALVAPAAGATRAADKRVRVNQNTREALDRLFKASTKAKALFDKAHGYAVFTNTKIALGISGGGGVGEAIDKAKGTHTYMRMATGGVGLGLGAQKYTVVFLFEDAQTFRNFVDKGWKAEGTAQAAAGTAGANAGAEFTNGMAVYQMTEGGLMASVDISGTKYWKSDSLNEK